LIGVWLLRWPLPSNVCLLLMLQVSPGQHSSFCFTLLVHTLQVSPGQPPQVVVATLPSDEQVRQCFCFHDFELIFWSRMLPLTALTFR
jgi:hypothetical protein